MKEMGRVVKLVAFQREEEIHQSREKNQGPGFSCDKLINSPHVLKVQS